MSWQANLGHADTCASRQDITCAECPYFNKPECPVLPCPQGKCTCHRDELVGAIEGVMDEAEKLIKLDPRLHGALSAALDRLNALGK